MNHAAPRNSTQLRARRVTFTHAKMILEAWLWCRYTNVVKVSRARFTSPTLDSHRRRGSLPSGTEKNHRAGSLALPDELTGFQDRLQYRHDDLGNLFGHIEITPCCHGVPLFNLIRPRAEALGAGSGLTQAAASDQSRLPRGMLSSTYLRRYLTPLSWYGKHADMRGFLRPYLIHFKLARPRPGASSPVIAGSHPPSRGDKPTPPLMCRLPTAELRAYQLRNIGPLPQHVAVSIPTQRPNQITFVSVGLRP